MKAKIYAVARGRATGLFTSWAECEKQVKNFPGARYKSFTTPAEALAWLGGTQGGTTSSVPRPKRIASARPPMPKRSSQTPASSSDSLTPAASDYTIYTDGSCLKNPGGPGGWAIVACEEKTNALTERSGGEKMTTNNRMELTAAIEALRFAPAGASVALYTDSQYLKNGLTKWIFSWKKRGWKKATGEPVLNQDLWQVLDRLRAARTVTFHWVKGHRGNARNERCDTLAKREALKFT